MYLLIIAGLLSVYQGYTLIRDQHQFHEPKKFKFMGIWFIIIGCLLACISSWIIII